MLKTLEKRNSQTAVWIIGLLTVCFGIRPDAFASPLWIDLGKDARTQRFVNFNEVLKVESATDTTGNPILRLYLNGSSGTLDTGDSGAMAKIKSEVATEKWLQLDPKAQYAYLRPASIQVARFACDASGTCTATLQAGNFQSKIIDATDYKQLHQAVSSASAQWFATQLTSTGESYSNLDYLQNIRFDSQGNQCVATLNFEGANTIQVKDTQGLARLKTVFGATCP